MKVNLLPERFKKKPFRITRVMTLLLPLLLILILVGLYSIGNNYLRTIEQEVRLLEIEHEALERSLFQARRLERDLSEIEDYISSFQRIRDTVNWKDLLLELGYLVGEGMQLNDFQISSNDRVIFNGQVTNYGLITALTYQIESSPYFKGSELKTTGMDQSGEKIDFWIEGTLVRGNSY